MAGFLDGMAAHASFAPLSSEQTLAVCQHLSDEIRQLQADVLEMRTTQEKYYASNAAPVSQKQLCDTIELMKTDADGLRDALTDVANKSEGTRKWTGQASQHMQKLKADTEELFEKSAVLGEGQRMANANIQKLGQGLMQLDKIAGAVRDTVESKVAADIEKLMAGQHMSESQLVHIHDSQEKFAEAQRQQRDELRKTNNNMQKLRDDLAGNEDIKHLLENRVGEISGGLKAVRRGLEEMNTAVLKMHEDHDITKSHVVELNKGLKGVSGVVSTVRSNVDQNVHDIADEKKRLEEFSESLEARRQSMARIDSTVRHVKDGQCQLQATTQILSGQVCENSARSRANEKGLIETNSMVLPNLVHEGGANDILTSLSHLPLAPNSRNVSARNSFTTSNGVTRSRPGSGKSNGRR